MQQQSLDLSKLTNAQLISLVQHYANEVSVWEQRAKTENTLTGLQTQRQILLAGLVPSTEASAAGTP